MILFRYTLPRLYSYFFIAFICLTFIFTASYACMHQELLTTISLPSFFIFILPRISIFSMPFAASLSVGIVVDTFFLEHEGLIFRFLSASRRCLFNIVAIFVISLTIFFVPLVFYIAPYTSWKVKNYIASSIKDQINSLEPQHFHTILPKVTFYFNDIDKKNKKNSLFKQAMLFIKDCKSEYSILTAKFCFLQKNDLIFMHGTMHHSDNKTSYHANFEKTAININRFFPQQASIKKAHQYMTIDELYVCKQVGAHIEYHKRLVHILWLLLMPFMSLWIMFYYAQKKSNLLLSIIISGILFLLSYVSIHCAHLYMINIHSSSAMLYVIIFSLAVVVYSFYKRKWL